MVFVFKRGDNFLEVFKKRLAEKGIKSGFFYGLGSFTKAELAYYDLKKKKYVTRKFSSGGGSASGGKNRPFEVLGLTGNLAESDNGELVIHCHTVLGKRDFKTVGGHLVEGIVGGTLEIFITLVEALKRKKDSGTGLNLLED